MTDHLADILNYLNAKVPTGVFECGVDNSRNPGKKLYQIDREIITVDFLTEVILPELDRLSKNADVSIVVYPTQYILLGFESKYQWTVCVKWNKRYQNIVLQSWSERNADPVNRDTF